MKFFLWFRRHWVWSGIILLALVGGGYKWYGAAHSTAGVTSYVVTTAQKQTLVQSVSATGQLEAVQQADVKAPAAVAVTAVCVKVGDVVKKGDRLISLDATDQQQAVTDAENNVKTAQLSLDKLNAPPDASTLLQAKNSVTQAKESLQNAKDGVVQQYNSALGDLSSAYLDFASAMSGMEAISHQSTVVDGKQNTDGYVSLVSPYSSDITGYRDAAVSNYNTARTAYDVAFAAYNSLSATPSQGETDAMISQTLNTAQSAFLAAKSLYAMVALSADKLTRAGVTVPTAVSGHQVTLTSLVPKMSSHVSGLQQTQSAIVGAKKSQVVAERGVAEKNASLKKLQAGPTEIDVTSQNLSITSRQTQLQQAKAKLADYTLRAPFDGTVAKVAVAVGDTAVPSTAAVTIMTNAQVITVTLNEVDAPQVKVGQKVTLTFDALSGFTSTGTVQEVDTLGTVTQNVFSYGATIALDEQSDKLRPGMSASAAIQVATKTDALSVPSSAVKSDTSGSYVDVVPAGATQKPDSTGVGSILSMPIERRNVTVGLSTDTDTEILSGLQIGDQVISRTITSTTSNTNTSSRSILNSFGGSSGGGNRGGAAGGAIRVGG